MVGNGRSLSLLVMSWCVLPLILGLRDHILWSNSVLTVFVLVLQWLHYLVVKLIHSKRLKAPPVPKKTTNANVNATTTTGTLSASSYTEKECYECLLEVEGILSREIAAKVRSPPVVAAVAKGRGGRRRTVPVPVHASEAIGISCAGDVVGYGFKKGWVAPISWYRWSWVPLSRESISWIYFLVWFVGLVRVIYPSLAVFQNLKLCGVLDNYLRTWYSKREVNKASTKQFWQLHAYIWLKEINIISTKTPGEEEKGIYAPHNRNVSVQHDEKCEK